MNFILLSFLGSIFFPIAFTVCARKIAETINVFVVMIGAGFCSALPWFTLWALARLNRQHCPSHGPCKLDGMQMIGEVLFLLATPAAFVFGAIIGLVIALANRK